VKLLEDTIYGLMRRALCVVFVLFVSSWLMSTGSLHANLDTARAVVLGIAQDGGVPHIGCRQELCVAARRDPARRQRVASVGLVDADGSRFLIDATPDIASQIESLWGNDSPPDRQRPVEGILLTHAHVGHYAGLMYLGREALGARRIPVYATPRMARFLRDNGPWSQLVSLGNIELREMTPGQELALSPRLRVTPLAVPHRDELSDTVGFRVRGPKRTLLYVPDIDKWERWDRRIEDEVKRADVALLDGTFYEAAEIPGRSQADIPHPLVGETASRLGAALRTRVRLLHLNHTNRLLWEPQLVEEPSLRGLAVARDGETFGL
jgi:pyrroloquinoline quinone biosynthesis protein B